MSHCGETGPTGTCSSKVTIETREDSTTVSVENEEWEDEEKKTKKISWMLCLWVAVMVICVPCFVVWLLMMMGVL